MKRKRKCLADLNVWPFVSSFLCLRLYYLLYYLREIEGKGRGLGVTRGSYLVYKYSFLFHFYKRNKKEQNIKDNHYLPQGALHFVWDYPSTFPLII